MNKTLVGGVGYHLMRDLSIGPVLTARLAEMSWPEHVVVDADFSYGPIAIVQRFKSEPDFCDKIVLFAAKERGLPPGTITTYRWSGELPDEDEIQARIGEALTGVVDLDNLLVVGEQFKIWPNEVMVLEVEPDDKTWGDGFSTSVAAVVDEVLDTIRNLSLNGDLEIEY
jgi:hydrogenase maturation protease